MRKEDQNNFCIFTTALDYIEHNLCSEFTQEDIAAVCYCSLSALQKLLRYATHTSLKEYISKRRLTNAGIDLLNTDMTVMDIAMNISTIPTRFSQEHSQNSGALHPRCSRKSGTRAADFFQSSTVTI